MKTLRIIGLIAVLSYLVFSAPVPAAAEGWHIECINRSCVASQGALKVYWMAGGMRGEGMWQGKLTGVEGIPISIEDYRTVERRIEQAMEKVTTRKRVADAGVKVDVPGVGGPTAGVVGTKENLFTKKQAQMQSRTIGRRVQKNLTLVFVEWLGDKKFRHVDNIRRYLIAASYALDAYKNGTIESMIERFLILRYAADIEHVNVTANLEADNKILILTKYIGLTRFTNITDVQQRYERASNFVYRLTTSPHLAEKAARISQEFINDIKALEILLKPDQTALRLYRDDNKDLAFAKWLANNNKFVENINQRPLQDKYIISIRIVDRFINDMDLIKTDMNFFTAQKEEFTTALKNRDESVKMVAIEGDSAPVPIIPIVAVVALGLLASIVVVTKRKKNKTEVS